MRRSGSRRTPSAAKTGWGRVGCPLADGGQGSGAGQHGGDRHGQHRAQRMSSAAPLSGVGELGEVVKQAAALVGCQRDGHVQPFGGSGHAR
jgi:hypothetical protein